MILHVKSAAKVRKYDVFTTYRKREALVVCLDNKLKATPEETIANFMFLHSFEDVSPEYFLLFFFFPGALEDFTDEDRVYFLMAALRRCQYPERN